MPSPHENIKKFLDTNKIKLFYHIFGCKADPDQKIICLASGHPHLPDPKDKKMSELIKKCLWDIAWFELSVDIDDKVALGMEQSHGIFVFQLVPCLDVDDLLKLLGLEQLDTKPLNLDNGELADPSRTVHWNRGNQARRIKNNHNVPTPSDNLKVENPKNLSDEVFPKRSPSKKNKNRFKSIIRPVTTPVAPATGLTKIFSKSSIPAGSDKGVVFLLLPSKRLKVVVLKKHCRLVRLLPPKYMWRHFYL